MLRNGEIITVGANTPLAWKCCSASFQSNMERGIDIRKKLYAECRVVGGTARICLAHGVRAVRWMRVRSLSSPSTLTIKSTEIWSVHYTGDFVYTNLVSNSYRLKINGAAVKTIPYAIVDSGAGSQLNPPWT